MKSLYIVDHYVPFPSSEYGGIWNVIAKDDAECFDLIVGEDFDNFYEKYYTDLRENIMNARVFPLVSNEISCVVESFTT
jgi:hypothetical protein